MVETAVRPKFIQNVEDLDVFKKAYSVSLELHEISLKMPKIEQYDLASQVRRASKSVTANLGEGFTTQRIYPGEFKRYIAISLKSCGELKIWLKYCLDLKYIDQAHILRLDDEYNQIIKMLAVLREKIGD